MTPTRPAGVTVIAVLHFVFGGAGLLCSLYSLGMNALFDPTMFAGMNQPQPQMKGQGQQVDVERIQKEMLNKLETKPPIPNKQFEIGKALVGIVLSVVVIVCGIGLLQLRPWARTVSILEAAVSIVFTLAVTIYTMVYIMPIMTEFADNLTRELGRAGGNRQQQDAVNMIATVMKAGMYGGLAISLVSLLYPIAVLIVLNTAKVKRAFAIPSFAEGDVYDEGTPRDYDLRSER